jgi:hypothetical protein
MSKTKSPNAAKLETLWTQWEKPTKASSLSLKDLSIKYLLFLDGGKELMTVPIMQDRLN